MGRFGLVDLFFPARCPVCGEIIAFGSRGSCDKCSRELPWIEAPVCLRCGKMIEDGEKEYCNDCKNIPKSFERCFPAFRYEGMIKDSIYRFKYNNQRAYAEFYAECIMMKYGSELKSLTFDGIIPVPVNRKKQRIRGYNQAGLIADELGKNLKVRVFQDYIVRAADTDPQKELNDTERVKNLKNAFIIGQNDVKLDKVLLVDDIYTSGATMEACTTALLSSGVGKVYCSSIAIGRGY